MCLFGQSQLLAGSDSGLSSTLPHSQANALSLSHTQLSPIPSCKKKDRFSEQTYFLSELIHTKLIVSEKNELFLVYYKFQK